MLSKSIVLLLVVAAVAAINNVYDPSKPRTCYSCSGSNCQRTSTVSANTTCADNLDICVTIFDGCKFSLFHYSMECYLIIETFQMKYQLEAACLNWLIVSAPSAIQTVWSVTSALATCATIWVGKTSSALSVIRVRWVGLYKYSKESNIFLWIHRMPSVWMTFLISSHHVAQFLRQPRPTVTLTNVKVKLWEVVPWMRLIKEAVLKMTNVPCAYLKMVKLATDSSTQTVLVP